MVLFVNYPWTTLEMAQMLASPTKDIVLWETVYDLRKLPFCLVLTGLPYCTVPTMFSQVSFTKKVKPWMPPKLKTFVSARWTAHERRTNSTFMK